MKNIVCKTLLYAALTTLLMQCGKSEIDYFGQIPPVNTPEIFMPGKISSTEYIENGCTFSPDGKEFYFSRMVNEILNIYACYYENGKWTEPEVWFSSDGHDFEPFITWDNKRLYCTRSNHADSSFESGLYYFERNDNGWSEPEFFRKGMYVSATDNGILYYSGMLPNGWISGDIESTEWVGDSFTEGTLPEGDLNSDAFELHPCVSRDGSFIIFVSRRTNGRDTSENYNDFYICFREENGTWSQARYLGDFLGKSVKMSPYISPDGEYLFFTCNNDIYWVGTGFLGNIGKK